MLQFTNFPPRKIVKSFADKKNNPQEYLQEKLTLHNTTM